MIATKTGKKDRYENARLFFLNCIAEEAARQGRPLSPAERDYLYAIGGADDKELRARQQKLDQEGDSDDFVIRASELLKARADRDISNRPAVKQEYDSRLEDLGTEDFLLWTIVVGGIHREYANRVGGTLRIGFVVGGIALVAFLLWMLINLLWQG